jgi:hypothetical protein
MGIGDATFRILADHFVPHGLLRHVGASAEAVRIFMIYAMQQAKAIPGVGGNTRIITLDGNGNISWEKSWKISAIQQFFSRFDQHIRLFFNGIIGQEPEQLLSHLCKVGRRDLRALRKELKRIEDDPALV